MSIELKGAQYAIRLTPGGAGMEWPESPGLYAFVDASAGEPRIVFIDETPNLRRAMQTKPYWPAAVELGATHVYGAVQAHGRSEIVSDLIATYRPALTHETPLGGATGINPTGINDVLDSMSEMPARAPSPTGVHDILDAMFEQSNPKDRFGQAQFEGPGAVNARFGARDRNPEAARKPAADLPKRRGLLDFLSGGHIRRP